MINILPPYKHKYFHVFNLYFVEETILCIIVRLMEYSAFMFCMKHDH